MKTRIKKRPAWQAFQEIFGEANENAIEEVSCYVEAETGNYSEAAGLAFDKAWDSAFDYGKVVAVIKKEFDTAFEAACLAAKEAL